MTQEGYQVLIILPIKNKMAAVKKQCFFAILVFTSVIKSPRFTNDSKFGISVSTYQ